MEPEPDRIDLAPLDPSADAARWERSIASVAARGREERRLRRAIVRRGGFAVVLAAAAGLVVWLSAPRHDAAPPRADILDWAVRDVQPSEVLGIGGNDHAR